MEHTWLHIDINSYFATLLQQEIPSLRGQPLGIVKDSGRTCIIAASKEAKVYGVKTGCLLKEAQQLCPKIKILPTFFPMYLSATKKLKDLFESLSPDVEIFSLDEVFIYFTPLRAHYRSPEAFAEKIQESIKKILGEWVSCNIGIAPNRFLAKMAGEVAAKGSITVVTEENKCDLLSTTTFKDVCGIGYRLGAKLEAMGVYTPYGINFLDDEILESTFGSFWVTELRKMAQGEEPHFLSHKKKQEYMRSVSRSITCSQKTWNDEFSIKRLLYNLSYEAMSKARRMKLAGRLVYISFKGDGVYWRKHLTLGEPIYHVQEFFDVVYKNLYPKWDNHFPVVKCTVALSLLKPWHTLQVPYFETWNKQEKLEQAFEAINEKYGSFTIRSSLLSSRDTIIWPEITGFFGDKDYYLNNNDM